MSASQPDTEDAIDVAVEEQGAWQRRLTVTVPKSRVERAQERARDDIRKRADLDGFRKGKVPPEIIEQKFGGLIREQAVQSLLSDTFQEALARKEINPLGQPEVSDVGFGPDGALTYKIDVEIVPRIELDRVGGFQVERPEVTVSEEEVDEVLERLREEHATWRPAEKRPATGDLVSVRIAPAEREEPLNSSDEYQFELGEGHALPEIEEAIKELEPGEREVFDIVFPAELREDVQEDEVRRMEIELRGVKEKELAPVDEHLADQAGDFETVEDLRDAIREDVRAHHREEAENAVREQLMDHVLEANPFQVPASMVDDYLDRMIDAPDGADPDEVESTRQQLRPQAERQIKRHLVLERLAEREGFEASDEEVERRIRDMAEAREVDPDQLRRRLARDDRLGSLRRQVAAEKAFEFLKEQSSVR